MQIDKKQDRQPEREREMVGFGWPLTWLANQLNP